MKKSLFIALVIFTSLDSSFGGTLVLEGKYQSENLYVLNGMNDNGVGFCTYEVSINDRVSTDEVNQTSFEIDFSQFNIKPGAHVIVKIRHKDDCSPKVINPEVLQPHATFEVTDINIDKNAILNWTTTNEKGSLPYIVEQFRWHKWIKIGEVKGKGSSGKNSYSFSVIPHSGENKFRVKQIGFGGASKKSISISYISSITEPNYTLSRDTRSISFSAETLFEVFNDFGEMVKIGYGKDLDIANLPKGDYFLCYDNVIANFKKKR